MFFYGCRVFFFLLVNAILLLGWKMLCWILLQMIVGGYRNRKPYTTGIRFLKHLNDNDVLQFSSISIWHKIYISICWQRNKKYIKLNNGDRVTASGKVLF